MPRRPRRQKRRLPRPLALAEVTALRRAGPGRIALEVDGRPWRTVPDEVVLRAGLAAGVTLERPVLRLVRAELGRAKAKNVAGRALARRELSSAELAARLERARVDPGAGATVLTSLQEAGLVDDERAARARAAALAERGYGNAAIAARLEAAGIASPWWRRRCGSSSRRQTARAAPSAASATRSRPRACSRDEASTRTSSRRSSPLWTRAAAAG